MCFLFKEEKNEQDKSSENDIDYILENSRPHPTLIQPSRPSCI